MDDIPYLLRGINVMETASSVLISSSKYLNSPRLRDWVAQELLRKNGPDLPTPSGAFILSGIIKELQDWDYINELIAAERKKWPELDRWFSERHVSTFTKDDLRKCAPDTVGGLFFKQLDDNGYQINIVPPYEPKTDYDYWLLRAGQTHDWEHIIGAGGFDSIGELIPGFMRLASYHKYFSPELACELTVMQFFASFRFLSRMALHYPHTWHAAWAAVDRGRRVGEMSEPFFWARYEDVFHLTPAAAREKLGIRGVEEVDTRAASAVWDGRMTPEEAGLV
jgi:ubiquinone biosynthesis protein Coq4